MKTDRSQLWEEYEDAAFAILMHTVAEQEGEQALQRLDELDQDPSAQLPEEVQQRAEETIRKTFAAQSRRSARQRGFRILRRIAVAALLIVFMTKCVFAVFPEIRTGILNTIIKTVENHTEFEFSSGNNTESQEYQIEPRWLPEGFTLSQSGSDYFSVWQLYASMDDPNASIYITKNKMEGQSLSVDTEDAVIQTVNIQGYESTLIKKEMWTCILLTIPEQGMLLHIESEGVVAEDTLKVAENLQIQ